MQIISPFVGSFLACFIDNYKHFYTHLRSECPKCHHRLNILDMIPIFSYILLKGRCRYCHKPINPFSLIIELSCLVVAFFISAYNSNILISFYLFTFYSCFLLITLIDIKYQEIPDSALFILLFLIGIKKPIITILILIIGFILSKKQYMGFGDIKLIAVIINALSLNQACIMMFLSSFTCLIFMLIKKQSSIYFGPFILLGWLLSII